MKAIGFLLLAALSVAGMYGVVGYIEGGHATLQTTQFVPWGLWVSMYVFFLGLSAGAFLLSTLVYVFGVRRLEPVGPLALLLAIGGFMLGGAIIIADLGHPERAWRVLFNMNPSSIMAWMGVFYNLYILICAIGLWLALRPRIVQRAIQGGPGAGWWRLLSLGSRSLDEASLQKDRRWLKILGVIGIPVAIIVNGGVGALFAVAKARPGWFSGLFPIVFLVTAFASGGALLTFLTAAFSRRSEEAKRDLLRGLARLTLGVLLFDLLLLFSDILVTFYGGIPHEVTGWNSTLFGPYSWVFWLVQIGFGTCLPIFLVFHPRIGKSIRALGAAGLLVVIGVMGARLNLVIPPQLEPMLAPLATTYHHPRWALGYFPSTVEFCIPIAAVAAGFWLFLIARRLLPLEETTS